MQDRDDSSALAMPISDDLNEIGRGACVNGVKRLIEEDHGRVLQQHAREKHALQLTHRQLADTACAEASQTHRVKRFNCLKSQGCGDSLVAAEVTPVSKHDHIKNANGKSTIDLGLLR